jgi:hypothetical protein
MSNCYHARAGRVAAAFRDDPAVIAARHAAMMKM